MDALGTKVKKQMTEEDAEILLASSYLSADILLRAMKILYQHQGGDDVSAEQLALGQAIAAIGDNIHPIVFDAFPHLKPVNKATEDRLTEMLDAYRSRLTDS